MGRARNRRKRLAKERAKMLSGWDHYSTDESEEKEMAGYVGAPAIYTSYGETPTHVMDLGDVEIWAGSGQEMLEELHLFDLVFDLRGFSTGMGEAIVRPDEAAKKVLPSDLYIDVTPPVIRLSWPDGGVLSVSRRWWERLYDWLTEEYAGGEEKRIGVFCVGGHGRTGTFLSILAGLGGLGDEATNCPVQWVRENYSEKAVETWSQIEYIEGITKMVVASSPSKTPVVVPTVLKG